MHTKQRRCLNTRDALQLAIDIAQNSNVQNSQHGAVAIGKRGHIVATGYNMVNMRQKKLPFLTFHAEERLIYSIKPNDLMNIKYVVVARRGSNPISKPCSRCARLLNKRLPHATIFYSV